MSEAILAAMSICFLVFGIGSMRLIIYGVIDPIAMWCNEVWGVPGMQRYTETINALQHQQVLRRMK